MLSAVDCPYSGEPFTTSVDLSAGSQAYIEDCPVCCRPIELRLTIGLDDEDYTLEARRDDV